MVRFSAIVAGVASGFLAAAIAFAQDAPAGSSQTPETVTVTGMRLKDQKALLDTIDQFVDLHSARDRKSGLLVRDAPAGVCPITMGLPDAYNQFITQRILTVAKQVGAGAQEAGKCHANVEIVFTNDPQGVVTLLSDRTRGGILGYHFLHEKGSVIHVYRPIQAWYVTGTKGDPESKSVDIGNDGTSEGTHTKLRIDDAYGQSPNTGTGSRIQPRNSSQIVNALIVADLNKVGGTEIGPLSDYVTMLALSQPQSLDGCNDFSSILDRMSTACAVRDTPETLTTGDIAYLKALYAADITTSAARGSENVASGMNANLAQPAAQQH
ncbi:MAG TPA: hypothetical protein VIJ85_09595 [Rhizomicrobium sp.]